MARQDSVLAHPSKIARPCRAYVDSEAGHPEATARSGVPGVVALSDNRNPDAARRQLAREHHGCLMRAYLALHLVPAREDGTRDVAVARLGDYEVRLVEAAPGREELSLELHDRFRRAVVDSVRCEDLEMAEVFSEEMILWAHELQSKKRKHSDCSAAGFTASPNGARASQARSCSPAAFDE